MNYPFESAGPALNVLALVLLVAFTALAIVAVLYVGALPGRIAAGRSHPQAEAIRVCGWLGLLTGAGWIVALVWAYWRSPAETSGFGVPRRAAEQVPLELVRQVERLEQAVARLEQQRKGAAR